MAYQALYRKWRPQTFASVIGQTAITTTLKNALKQGTISHAYLFAGPRGTGKTSCAKILAKALNCTNLKNGEPCNHCANCLAANKGTMPDLIEIDAASNNGVDEIRSIRDKVKYAPTQGKYKVYIIDEVHMLSIGAFNALLKTLEEPPVHVVFILATTELQKVPATIISRTQRYNFRRLSLADLEKRMSFILKEEKIKYEPRALKVIARVADGSMRDALSILDQLLSYEKASVTYEDALKLTGFAARAEVEKLLLLLLQQKTEAVLKQAHQLMQNGASVQNLLSELINLTTQALLLIKSKDLKGDNFLTKDFISQIDQVPPQRYFSLVSRANKALNDLRYTNQQRIPFDVFLLAVCQKQVAHQAEPANQNAFSNMKQEMTDLKDQVRKLSERINHLPVQQATVNDDHLFHLPSSSGKIKKNKPTSAEHSVEKVKRLVPQTKHRSALNRKQVYHVLAHATRQDLTRIKNVWPDLQSVLAVSQRALLDVLQPVAASPKQVVMKCKYTLWFEKASADSDLLKKLTSQIQKFTKHVYQIVLVPDKDWLSVRKQFVDSHKQELLSKTKDKVDVHGQKQADKKGQLTAKKDNKKVITRAKELFGETVHVKD